MTYCDTPTSLVTQTGCGGGFTNQNELLFCLCKTLGKTPPFPLEIALGVSKVPLRSRSHSGWGFSNLTLHLSFLPSHAFVLGKSANVLKFSGYAADSISHIASTRRRPSASRKRIFVLGATQQSSSTLHSISVATQLINHMVQSASLPRCRSQKRDDTTGFS
eukprot:scaffold141723_cov96-Phaeocystis_antarctica.AAC.1